MTDIVQSDEKLVNAAEYTVCGYPGASCRFVSDLSFRSPEAPRIQRGLDDSVHDLHI